MRVLIADDDPTLVSHVTSRLRRAGHHVSRPPPHRDVADVVAATNPHLLILDSNRLPFPRLLDLCHALRHQSATLLLVVGQLSKAERTRVLEAGADDYLAKPADPDELLAHVRALLRRHIVSALDLGTDVLPLTATWRLDVARRRLVAEGREERLTDTEFKLLACLVRNEGMAMSREALIECVWGMGYAGQEREVDVYIRYLRQKLELDASAPRYIVTVRGQGYMFQQLEGEEGAIPA